MFGIEVDSLAKVAGTCNLMPDLDGTVKDYRNIDVGVRPGAAASLRTVKDELLETRTVDLFEAFSEGGERG